ncbi:MAG: heavy-metal-associated domain-containing protein [Sphingomonadaceae bacterium]|nr:heavy-metal-associated domain-containing protein [Sphingomonadaceae bacterium]
MKAAPRYIAFLLGLMGLAAIVYAQIEGGDRGVAPLDSSGSFEVSGINVDVRAKDAESARLGGWRIAQRKGWQLLWAKMHGGDAATAPTLADSALDSIVAGIVVDDEQTGPSRYVAKLGVLFDRARAGQILGVSGQIVRSPPLLVIPVEWSGGGPRSFEARTEWQKAWARFRAGGSPIDYVRPPGIGPDPLLLTAGQAQRPGRIWWRTLLDLYGASDVLSPQVRLERLWPGGPVIGHFSARHGPDDRLLSGFTLRIETSDSLPAMMDEGVRRIDQIYADALAMGMLRPDPSLTIETPIGPDSLVTNESEATPVEETGDLTTNTDVNALTVQFDTPDVASVGATEAAVRGTPGVKAASTSSLALGGVSVMRVSFAGDLAALKLALTAHGLRVEEGSGALRIRRAAATPAPSAPPGP